jgi:hypothetical protein
MSARATRPDSSTLARHNAAPRRGGDLDRRCLETKFEVCYALPSLPAALAWEAGASPALTAVNCTRECANPKAWSRR